MTQTILVLDAISEDVAQKMRDLLPPDFELNYAKEPGDDHLVEIIGQADYAISGQVAVNGRIFRAAKQLQLLHKWGVGVDNLDLEAARECGIKVARTTGSNALAVAEFTVGLIICTLRHIPHGHFGLQHDRWQNWRGRTPFLLSGKTVGLVGFGAIGKAVAGVLAGFHTDTCYYKPNRLDPGEEEQHGVRYLPLEELLTAADVISLHCPLSPNTSGLIDRAALSSMKNTATLINVARGGVVVEQDLIWALENDVIHSAAIDVYEIEPLPAGSPLVNVKNLTLTPHLGAMAADTFAPTVERMFANIASVSRGEAVPELDSVL